MRLATSLPCVLWLSRRTASPGCCESLTLLLAARILICLGRYSVDNVPCMVAVSLKRFDEQLLKIESQVDFPSQLHLHKYSKCLALAANVFPAK